MFETPDCIVSCVSIPSWLLLQEKELLEQHSTWLSRELAGKAAALAQERQAAAEREADLATKLAAAEKSGSDSSSAAERARERVAALEGQLEQAQRKQREAADAASEGERHFNEELHTVSLQGTAHQCTAGCHTCGSNLI